jgi:hypothetical protein
VTVGFPVMDVFLNVDIEMTGELLTRNSVLVGTTEPRFYSLSRQLTLSEEYDDCIFLKRDMNKRIVVCYHILSSSKPEFNYN